MASGGDKPSIQETLKQIKDVLKQMEETRTALMRTVSDEQIRRVVDNDNKEFDLETLRGPLSPPFVKSRKRATAPEPAPGPSGLSPDPKPSSSSSQTCVNFRFLRFN